MSTITKKENKSANLGGCTTFSDFLKGSNVNVELTEQLRKTAFLLVANAFFKGQFFIPFFFLKSEYINTLSMARLQKKNKPNSVTKPKKQVKKQYADKLTSKDVFEAEEQTDRRKGHELDRVDNLEYDAGEIDEEDDEEIDSDEAFDESDEERFEGYKFRGSTKVCKKLQPSFFNG